MSSSLWKKLFSNKTSSNKKSVKQHASHATPQKKDSSVPSKNSRNEVQDMAKTKQEIEQFKKLISNKITDPTLAKKAAQIIEDMLKEDGKEKPKNNKKAS